jgi:hypothetical protein
MKNMDAFFKFGLISMIIELCNLDVNVEEVLSFFCKIELDKHIIYEIYNRGMLNKLVSAFS